MSDIGISDEPGQKRRKTGWVIQSQYGGQLSGSDKRDIRDPQGDGQINPDTKVKPFCRRCCGLGSLHVTPDKRGWLRRPDLETANEMAARIQIWETPAGNLSPLERPWRLVVACPCKKGKNHS